MIYALGIDPGVTSGWALVSLADSGRPRLELHGAAKHLPYRDVIADITIRAGALEQVVCQIEGQFVPGDAAHRAQAVDSLSVAASRGAWEEACSTAGWRVLEPVLPNVWRKAVFGSLWCGSMPREVCKTLAIHTVAGLHGLRLPRSADHVAEAILIARYAAELTRHLERIESARVLVDAAQRRRT